MSRACVPERPVDRIGATQFLLRSVARSGAWALGLALACWVVPGVSVSASGFIVALVFFSIAQTALSRWILKLPHGWASMLLGFTGLTLTFVAMSFTSASTHALRIRDMTSWLAGVMVVWLVTTIGAVLLFDVYVSREGIAASTGTRKHSTDARI
jgi:hypothetical protein